jgi:hypothetical protein
MPAQSDPDRTTIQGVEVIVVSPQDYERFSGYRRQVGAQAAQIRSLKQALTDATALLEQVEQLCVEMEAGHLDLARARARLSELFPQRTEGRTAL